MLERIRAWFTPTLPVSDTALLSLLEEYGIRADITPSAQRLRDYTQTQREEVKDCLRHALAERFPLRTWSIALLHGYLAVVPDRHFKEDELYYILYWDVESLAEAILAIKY